MMTRTQWILPLGFAASTLATGVPYWSMPYQQVNLPNALYGPGLLVLFLGAVIAQTGEASTFWKRVAIFGSSLPVVVLIRVAAETLADPTSHNLWPFEVIIACALGGLCALSGAMVGWAIAKIRAIAGR
jgi:hypothetical protein